MMTDLSPSGSNSLKAPLANSERTAPKSNVKLGSANAILTKALNANASLRAE
jgi:hypothetical protein